MIAQGQQWFSNCRNPLIFELDAKAFLIDCFEKATTFFVVHFEAGANDRVTLALVNDFGHLIRVNSRDSRAPAKRVSFLSGRAMQFRIQPYLRKFPVTPCGYS